VGQSHARDESVSANHECVADLCNLAYQILIKVAQHGELRDLAVGQLQRAKRVRQGARGLINDVGVPRIGLGLTGVQVGNARHRKSRQIGNQHAQVAGSVTIPLSEPR
jgi:hypothetical protein